MPASSRKTDIASGHGPFPPSPATAGSTDVIINGLPALREGDSVLLHACPKNPPHPRSVSSGSPTVFVNGKALARIGDAVDCGGKMVGGSANVFADDNT